jgi:circadian clock protein KaiC
VRPNLQGLEMHLLDIHDRVQEVKPRIVIIDPITNLLSVGDQVEVRSMLPRLIDFFKSRQITTLFTSLVGGGAAPEQSEVGVSSLMDVWIWLRNLEHNGERNRGLYVLKSRGMPHSNQVREFILSSKGIELVDVYTGGGEVLTGTARLAQEAQEKADAIMRQQQVVRTRREIESKRQTAQAQIALLQAQLDSDLEVLNQTLRQDDLRGVAAARERKTMARARNAGSAKADPTPKSE